MEFKIPSLKQISLYKTAIFFWNTSLETKNLQFGEIKSGVKQKWEKKLSRCREEAEQKLNYYTASKKLAPVFEIPITQIICSLHRSFYRLLLWKAMYDPSNKIALMQEGQLYAPNFFNVNGDFDDVSLAKRFVCDPNYDMIDRFSLACAFWFEKESEKIWWELKVLYGPEIADKRNCHRYFRDHLKLTWHRILTLELDLSVPIHHLLLETHYLSGFHTAFLTKYEHAAYYFWGKLSQIDKRKILTNDIFLDVLEGETDYPKDKIIYFLLPMLSEEIQKEILISSLHDHRFDIWYVLLLSPTEGDVQSKLIDWCKRLPSQTYCDLINALARKVMQFRFPSELRKFSQIWENRKFREQRVLKSCFECVQILAKAKSFNKLGYLIRHLSNEEKYKCLLHNLYGAGTTVLDILIKENEFDMFNRYLTYFLTEIDIKSQKDVLRRDARVLLETFLLCDNFIEWYNNVSVNNYDKLILYRIYSLKEIIIVLDELCDNVCFNFPMR